MLIKAVIADKSLQTFMDEHVIGDDRFDPVRGHNSSSVNVGNVLTKDEFYIRKNDLVTPGQFVEFNLQSKSNITGNGVLEIITFKASEYDSMSLRLVKSSTDIKPLAGH